MTMENFKPKEWISEWDNIAKSGVWFLSIIAGFWVTPPSTPEQERITANITGFIVCIAVVFAFYLTQEFTKYYHAKIWLRLFIVFLVIFLSSWFFKSSWICNYENGKSFVMGYELTPTGIDSQNKPNCQKGCEALIHDCNHDNPARVWTSESIEQIRLILIINHFLIAIVLVLLITSAIQTVKVLQQPNLRKKISGKWEGNPSHETKVELLMDWSSNNNVGGSFSKKIGTFYPKNIIEKSKFKGEFLYFSVLEKTISRPNNSEDYRIDTSPILENKLTLYKLENENYVFYCILHRCENEVQNIDSNLQLTT